jgi:hypothetical protein
MTEDANATGRPRFPRRGLLVVGIVAVAVLIALAVWRPGGDDSSCEAVTAAPSAQTALLPARLSLDRIGTITHVRKDGDHVEVEAVSSKPLDEVTVLIQDAVAAAGYRPAGMDNEGDEAEVFFTTGSLAAGQGRVEESDCDGRWDIELVLLDRPDAR